MIGTADTQSCEECGKWLTGRQTRFCSPKCKMRARRRDSGASPAEKVCTLCGASFRPLRGKQVFCDYTDQADASCSEMQNARDAQRLALDEERWEALCAHCEESTGWDGVGRPRKFCSDRCKQAFYRAAKRACEPV
ncbi:hypothetical protein AB0N28_06055 [Streptomyces sp. NPDC051130]|uniref:hypothetical protein n=1 Tax=Streptomyces sp. NPDC051130 TaxID=3157223 RepID=UPI003446C1D0